MANQWDLMQDCIPADHARQVTSEYYVEQLAGAPGAPDLVLDLGCGVGASAATFARHRPGIRWVGVDIVDSPESSAREGAHTVVLFDGVRLPFPEATFPLVYSHQVLEHVRDPVALLAEVARVLAPGGAFFGSTSQLEPYHSYSVWNYTLYGFRLLVEQAGLELAEVRPGIDGVSLTMRSFHGRPEEWLRHFVEESPLNQEIDEWAARTGRKPKQANNRKLQFCGQFAFLVRKPPTSEPLTSEPLTPEPLTPGS